MRADVEDWIGCSSVIEHPEHQRLKSGLPRERECVWVCWSDS